MEEIIIETPRDSREKYVMDKGGSHLFLKKRLPLGMSFPYDFGSIPGTRAEDGDAADALVISEFRSYPGCRLQAKLIGALLAEQSGNGQTIRNDRYIFIAETSTVYQHIAGVNQFPEQHNEELKQFFINYNKAEGKTFIPLEYIDAKKAEALLKELRLK